MSNAIKSSYKIFEVLELISFNEEISVTEISNQTGYTMSTTQRIVNTLVNMKYIVQDLKTLKYRPSYKLYALGNRVQKKNPLLNVTIPHLNKLFELTNETINLGTIEKGKIVYLHKIISNEPLRIEMGIGFQAPFYCTALGKAMVAFDRTLVSKTFEIEKHTSNTLKNLEEFDKELLEIKKLGYAVDNEEFMQGLYCIGKPILDQENKPVACISVSFPVSRKSREKESFLIREITKTVKAIEKDLFDK